MLKKLPKLDCDNPKKSASILLAYVGFISSILIVLIIIFGSHTTIKNDIMAYTALASFSFFAVSIIGYIATVILQLMKKDNHASIAAQTGNQGLALFVCLFVIALVISATNDNKAQNLSVNKPANEVMEEKKIEVTSKTENPKILDKIKVRLTVDYGAQKDGATKYVVDIENTSDKEFSGKIDVIPSTAPFMERASHDISSLLPGATIRVFSFAKLKPDTTFSYAVSGAFKEMPTPEKKSDLEYTIIKKRAGNGFITFWVFTQDNSKDKLIAISKIIKNTYSSNLPIGLAIVFVDSQSKTGDDDGFAMYNHTKSINLSRLTLNLDTDNEKYIDGI